MDSQRLFLIDGMSHVYRAFYAIRNLSNSRGLPTNAIYGFTSMLRRLIQEQKPEYIAVAIDLEGPTVRHEQFEAYKATRKPIPSDLIPQLPYIRRVCDVFRVPVIGYEKYEADDVIGTLSLKAAERGLISVIVTSDKDMMQLVSDKVLILDTMKDNLFYDARKVEEKLGVPPERVIDLLGLWGDASDNIPGAPGIGEKGARELIQTYGTIEKLLENQDMIKRKAYRESLRDNAGMIRMSRELATIRRDLPIDLDLDALILEEPDRKTAFALFSELEFNSLMKEFLDEEEHKPLGGDWLADHQSSGADAVLKALLKHGRVYLEFNYVDGDIPGHRTADVACVQGGADDALLFDLTDGGHARQWRDLCLDASLERVCWDAKSFLFNQESHGISMSRVPDDVMLMAFLTAPNAGDYSLKRWALDQLHFSLEEEKARKQGSLLPEPEKPVEYLFRRIDAVRRLHETLGPRLDEHGLRKLYEEIELPLVPVLADMERTGIKVDRGMFRKMSDAMEKRIAELTVSIYEAAGTEFNINSPRQLGEILFEKLNLPILKKTRKTGGYSTDQGVLEDLARTYDLPRLILEYRQVAKLKSTYVDAIPLLINPKTGRIHTSFNQTGAATGRLSSSDPNLQNIPIRSEMGRLIRSAFVPERGNLLLSADYSQVELRVLAHLSGDEVLVGAFRDGEDIHDRTAREVFSGEELENRAECRRRAKVINFGIVYGLSAFGLSQTLGISREEAQAFIDRYFIRYRGVRAWLDRTLAEAHENEMVRTLYGRIRPVPDINSNNFTTRSFAERIAVNSPIQGTAADIVKVAMINVHRILNKRRLSAKLLLQVHDELVLEAPETEVEEVRSLVREEMEGAAGLCVPLKVDINVADNWMDMK
ncbi:MAG TPA: DNA polymerase I [Acidobacteriota bacterium]|nr:DNA polymerase I [Acidobacteriota bacterium]